MPAHRATCFVNLTLTGSGYARLNGAPQRTRFVPLRLAMTVDGQTFREALSRFASGVCVLTTVGRDGRPVGMTISAFTSLSLTPPLVLFCLGKRSANLSAWLHGSVFSVNVLAEDQAKLSDVFAGQNADKFAGIAGGAGTNGCFRIDGCLVTLECRRTRTHDEGDHYIIVALVERVHFGGDAGPLLRFRGAYDRLA